MGGPLREERTIESIDREEDHLIVKRAGEAGKYDFDPGRGQGTTADPRSWKTAAAIHSHLHLMEEASLIFNRRGETVEDVRMVSSRLASSLKIAPLAA